METQASPVRTSWAPWLRQADPERLDAWIHEHYQDVYRFMLHLSRQREIAEDLTQITFVKAWKNVKSFQGQSSMRVWLHTIAYREYISQAKRQKAETSIDDSQDPAYHPKTEDRLVIDWALGQLPPELREVFVLNEVVGHTFEEMTLILGHPSGTLKSRAVSARQRLKELLALHHVDPS